MRLARTQTGITTYALTSFAKNAGKNWNLIMTDIFYVTRRNQWPINIFDKNTACAKHSEVRLETVRGSDGYLAVFCSKCNGEPEDYTFKGRLVIKPDEETT